MTKSKKDHLNPDRPFSVQGLAFVAMNAYRINKRLKCWLVDWGQVQGVGGGGGGQCGKFWSNDLSESNSFVAICLACPSLPTLDMFLCIVKVSEKLIILYSVLFLLRGHILSDDSALL